jgi:hypothetical protein
MSVITHERLHAAHRLQGPNARQRATIRIALKRAAVILLGGAIMLATVTAIIGLKSFFILSRLPLVH